MKTTAFKMTELGPIPSDWEVKRLGEIFTFKNGYNANASCYGSGIPVVSVLDALGNKPITYQSIGLMVRAPNKDRAAFSLKAGDLVFTRSSETLEDVGRSNVYLDEANAMFGGFVIRGRPSVAIDSLFVNYMLNTASCRIRVMSQGAGAQHFNIGQSGLENVLIPLPPLPEQRRIAAALSDVDELIGALGKLVEKKRAIKTGAMQRLLTGQTRLPGFGGAELKQTELGPIPSDWEVKRLGNVCDICTGKRNGDEQVENGLYPFFVRSSVVYRINTYSYEGEAILVPGEGGIGEIFHYINGRFDYHQRVYKLSDFSKEVFARFVYYYLRRYFGDWAKAQTVKATVDSLRLPTFEQFRLILPTLPEQRAIAAVLSDMDAEIAALEAEQAKYTRIKSGMMQELLTGKTRLR